jgi:hypothetical protein
MGEAFHLVNLDKREWLNPMRFMEEEALRRVDPQVPSIVDLGTPVALQVLLQANMSIASVSGRWSGDHVAIVGEYYKSPQLDGDRV